MAERLQVGTGRDCGDRNETEKLLDEARDEQQEHTDAKQCTFADTSYSVSWSGSTEDSVDIPPKSTHTTVLADHKHSNGNLIAFLRYFYRRDTGAERVTPFAVVLLLVLLTVYVLNQADRLVLPVVIPNGLRCNVGKEDCASSNSTNASDGENDTSRNASSRTGDCIQFNDDQQGFLTGNVLCCTSYYTLSCEVFI